MQQRSNSGLNKLIKHQSVEKEGLDNEMQSNGIRVRFMYQFVPGILVYDQEELQIGEVRLLFHRSKNPLALASSSLPFLSNVQQWH
jgi:hypothetical protein